MAILSECQYSLAVINSVHRMSGRVSVLVRLGRFRRSPIVKPRRWRWRCYHDSGQVRLMHGMANIKAADPTPPRLLLRQVSVFMVSVHGGLTPQTFSPTLRPAPPLAEEMPAERNPTCAPLDTTRSNLAPMLPACRVLRIRHCKLDSS